MAINKKRGVDRLMVDLPLETAAQVKHLAERERRSVSFVMRELIMRGISQFEKAPASVEEEQAPYGELEKKPKKHNKPA